MLTALNGTAVQVQADGVTDVFGVANDSTGLTVGDMTTTGTHVLLREQGGAAVFGILTRGNLLTVAGRTLLRSVHRANAAWRAVSGGALVEAEPAYNAAGGADSLTIGGLTADKQHSVTLDGLALQSMQTDANGALKIAVDLTKRLTVRIVDASKVIPACHPHARIGCAGAFTIYDIRGEAVRKMPSGSLAGMVTAGLPAGVYYVKNAATLKTAIVVR